MWRGVFAFLVRIQLDNFIFCKKNQAKWVIIDSIIRFQEEIMENQEKVEQAVYQLLEALGENPEREGLLDTPKRVAKM